MSSSKRGRSLAEVMSPIDEDPDEGRSKSLLVQEADAASSSLKASVTSVVPVNVLVTPEDRKRLRQLSLDTSLSLQKLGHEAWNLLLQSRGLKPLKSVSANVPSGRATASRTRSRT